MDDKEFPELFTRLGYRDVGAVKNAAGSMVTKLQEVPANVAATGLRERYAKNDLGNLIADVNYALKRLVKGMNSENHAVKKGFFLALVEVLKAFHANVDEKRLITYIVRESKITASMKPQEANAAAMGRFLSLSALIEVRLLSDELIGALADLYKS